MTGKQRHLMKGFLALIVISGGFWMARKTKMFSPHLLHDDYAAIGAAVVAFGYLEHEVLRAAIGLQGGPDAVSEADEVKYLEEGSTLGKRLEYLRQIAKNHDVDAEWFEDFDKKCSEGVKWRNAICHGSWERLQNGRLQVTFYGRGCVKRGHPDVETLTADQIREIAVASFENAKLLAQLHDD